MTKPFLSLRAANIARNELWSTGSDGFSLPFRATELAGEVGEACNIIKKLERERLGVAGSRATKQQLAEELADVVICADLIAMDTGIDLDQAVRDKFNATSEKNDFPIRLVAPSTGTYFTALKARVAELEDALKLYRDGFYYRPKRSRSGVNLSEWFPTETLLQDAGETARAVLAKGGQADA